MDYTLDKVELLHDYGSMPDWVYYQLNGKSLQENYQDMIQKRQQNIREKKLEELLNQEIEKEVSEYIEKSLNSILENLLKDNSINIII